MLNQLRIAHKLWAAVILIVLMLVAVVGFAAYRSAKVQVHADAVAKEMESRVQAALRWSRLRQMLRAPRPSLSAATRPWRRSSRT